MPNGLLVNEPAEPIDARPAITIPPEIVVPPRWVLALERVNEPGVALTVSRLSPLIFPDSLAAIELNVRELLPVAV